MRGSSAVIWWEACYTLDRLPVKHRATNISSALCFCLYVSSTSKCASGCSKKVLDLCVKETYSFQLGSCCYQTYLNRHFLQCELCSSLYMHMCVPCTPLVQPNCSWKFHVPGSSWSIFSQSNAGHVSICWTKWSNMLWHVSPGGMVLSQSDTWTPY